MSRILVDEFGRLTKTEFEDIARLHGRKDIVKRFEKTVIHGIIARRKALLREPRRIKNSVVKDLGGVKVAGKSEKFGYPEVMLEGGAEFFERIHNCRWGWKDFGEFYFRAERTGVVKA